MPSHKECVQDLVEGFTITGIAGGIFAQAQGTLCFNIDDDKDHIETIKLPGMVYILSPLQNLLCPLHLAKLDDDDGTYIKNTSTVTGCWLVCNKE